MPPRYTQPIHHYAPEHGVILTDGVTNNPVGFSKLVGIVTFPILPLERDEDGRVNVEPVDERDGPRVDMITVVPLGLNNDAVNPVKEDGRVKLRDGAAEFRLVGVVDRDSEVMLRAVRLELSEGIDKVRFANGSDALRLAAELLETDVALDEEGVKVSAGDCAVIKVA
ncbi:MAG: hypothetical protein Q9157_004354 [Trypethelium eluteriae]